MFRRSCCQGSGPQLPPFLVGAILLFFLIVLGMGLFVFISAALS